MNLANNRITASLMLAAIALLTGCGGDSGTTPVVEWPMYRGDLAGTGYSPLTQINAGNVATLEAAWSYSLASDNAAEPGEPNSQATPIVVNGIMYLPAIDRVVALDPATGREMWRQQLNDPALSRRGVSYWPGDETTAARIFFTAGSRLIAVNARNGLLVNEFGESGEIDLGIPYISVPMVFENTIIVGANTPRGAAGGIGNARAFDARTGAKLWEFNSVPTPGSLGNETWAGNSWEGRLGANAWPFYFTVDAQRKLLYIPLASPLPFAYGGDRQGSNLFANSLVAVDIHSGEYRWHYQTIHHDLWDHDPPAPPVLFDVQQDGAIIPALGVTTKSGYLYILNRETGEPIYSVEERAVAQSEVPGELTSATQPIPANPPALARVSFAPLDLVTADDTSAEHAAACTELLTSAGDIYNAGAFTPWVYRADASANGTTLLFPGLVGGPNWGGAAFNPDSGMIFVFSQDIGSMGWIEPAAEGSAFPYQLRGPRPASFDVAMGESRWPCQKPPWGKLSAVDSSTGSIVWQQAIGITEELPVERQNTGRPGRAGAIVTAGNLLFIAATDDNRLRALDASTGEELWVTTLGRRGNANPMTFQAADGNQYVVIAATNEVVAYRLP